MSLRCSSYPVFVIVALLLGGGSTAVQAQVMQPTIQKFDLSGVDDVRNVQTEAEPETLVPVDQREFSEFTPKGLSLGKFTAFPSLTTTARYDDNLYATNQNAVSDYSVTIEPKLTLQTGKENHYFVFQTAGKAKRYASEKSEDTDDGSIGLAGYLDVIQGWKLPFSFSYETIHQDRQDNLARTFTETPTQVKTGIAEGGIAYQPNRLGLKLLGRFIDRTFSNEEAQNTTGLVVRDDADFQTGEIEAEVSYEFPVDHIAYLKAKVGKTDYIRGIFDDNAGVYTSRERDSSNYAVLAGIRSNIKGIVTSDLQAGVAGRNYDDATISDVEDAVADAKIKWNITKLTTLGFDGSYQNVEDNEILQGFAQTSYGIGIDHELRRNIILKADTTWINRDFAESTREDDLQRYGLGVDYKVAPQLSLGADYSHTTQDSNNNGSDFERNLYMLRLTGQY